MFRPQRGVFKHDIMRKALYEEECMEFRKGHVGSSTAMGIGFSSPISSVWH
jgi:hypothetical protein